MVGELSNALGVVSSKNLPDFSVDVLQAYLVVKDQYKAFTNFVKGEGADIIKELIEKYATIPSFEENPDYYYDWGSTEIFSVINKGQAECSAGLFDMIDVDLNFIKEGFALLEQETGKAKINRILYDLIFSSSRMLLITKGAEPKSTSEASNLFIKKFIREGLVSESFETLVKTADTQKEYDFSIQKFEVLELANAVIQLYEGMDDSLQFKNQPLKPVETHSEENTAGSSTGTLVKDFRGVACPMNFVKTKIELSSLKSGDLLEIWLDDGQPIQNVPGSVRSEGHEILSATNIENYWKVLIKKA